jgi:hypothetical protein
MRDSLRKTVRGCTTVSQVRGWRQEVIRDESESSVYLVGGSIHVPEDMVLQRLKDRTSANSAFAG